MNKRLEHDVQVLVSPLLSSLRADEIKLWLMEFSYRLHAGYFSVVLTESGHPLKTVHSVYLAESLFI